MVLPPSKIDLLSKFSAKSQIKFGKCNSGQWEPLFTEAEGTSFPATDAGNAKLMAFLEECAQGELGVKLHSAFQFDRTLLGGKH